MKVWFLNGSTLTERDFKIDISVPLKVHWCIYENISISSSSNKNNMPKVLDYSTAYFLRYTHPRYMKCLFENIGKQ